jgi:hypothetical protein
MINLINIFRLNYFLIQIKWEHHNLHNEDDPPKEGENLDHLHLLEENHDDLQNQDQDPDLNHPENKQFKIDQIIDE